MFLLTTIVDTIRVPAHMLALPTLVALHSEIDLKYPNRVLMDVGLVVCCHGDILKITNGSCVPGDGGSHHECLFRLVVFRPFVEEVCIGKIVKSSAEGVQVSIGFFQDIFIPAYWMLRPSCYDERLRLWVWTPNYDDDGDDDDPSPEEKEEKEEKETASATNVTDPVTSNDTVTGAAAEVVKQEGDTEENTGDGGETTKGEEEEEEEAAVVEKGDRFEMEIGAEIRFKVKSIHFTQVTNTAKGVQATTTTTAHSHSFPKDNQQNSEEKTTDKPLRKRSLSVDLSDVHNLPASMHIVASICEDGLGLTSWWTSAEEEGEEEEEEEEEEGANDQEDVEGQEEYEEEES
jgi:DNA-directed RNA polymerase III subunit RPC8